MRESNVRCAGVTVILLLILSFAGCIGQEEEAPETVTVITTEEGKVTTKIITQTPQVDSDGDGVPDAEDKWPGRNDKTFGETLVIATIESPHTLDPHWCYETGCNKIISEAYQPLVDWVSDEVGPALATSWEISPDGLEYTFHLQEGVTFTTDSDNDGKLDPFNAYAVKYSFERFIKINGPPAWLVADFLDKIDIIDDYTVKMTLKFAYAPFIYSVLYTEIMNPYWVEAHGGIVEGQENEFISENMDGTGPYMLEEWKRGEREVLVANPNYRGGWEGNHVQKIIWREIPEMATRQMLLTAGDVDIAYIPSINIPDLERTIKAENLPIVIPTEVGGKPIVSMQIFLLYFNCKQLPFTDKFIRKAFSYAFPYQQIIDSVVFGKAVRPTSLIPQGVSYYQEDVPTYDLDLTKAQEMLDKASPAALAELEKGVTFHIVPDLGISVEGALLWQASLSQLGINMEVREIDESAWIDALLSPPEDAFKMGQTFWVMDAPDADNIIYAYAHTSQWAPQSWNPTFWGNATTDSWIEEARAETDPEKRDALYLKITTALYEDAPWIYAFQPAYLRRHDNVLRSWVHGWKINPMDYCLGSCYYPVYKEPTSSMSFKAQSNLEMELALLPVTMSDKRSRMKTS